MVTLEAESTAREEVVQTTRARLAAAPTLERLVTFERVHVIDVPLTCSVPVASGKTEAAAATAIDESTTIVES